MAVEIFLDTNVIVYAVDMSPASSAKRTTARGILRASEFGLSAQVLQEFYVTTTRELKRPLSVLTAARWVEQLSRAEFVGLDLTTIKLAIAYSQRHQISHWDGAIIAAAEALGAATVYSEDLSDGQRYGSVTIENPFRGL